MDVRLLQLLQKRRQFAKWVFAYLSNLVSVNSLRITLNPSRLARAPASICSQVISAGRGKRAPQERFSNIEGQNRPGMLRTKGSDPPFHGRNNVRLVVFDTFR